MTADDMSLPMLPHGRHERVTVAVNGSRLAVVKVGGVWHAMNYRSSDPCMLRNRSERSTWAHLVGMTGKDVEAYVRRKKREKLKEAAAEELEHAKRVMTANGYEVIE